MKNKKGLTKILIVVVAGLWAYNIYNTIQNHQLKNDSIELTEENHSTLPPILYNKDSFDLKVSRYDPFLERQTISTSHNRQVSTASNQQTSNSQQTANVQATATEPAFSWPKIEYLGFVKNHSTAHQLCLIKLNHNVQKIAVGDSFSEITLISAWKDSILFQHQELQKTVLR